MLLCNETCYGISVCSLLHDKKIIKIRVRVGSKIKNICTCKCKFRRNVEKLRPTFIPVTVQLMLQSNELEMFLCACMRLVYIYSRCVFNIKPPGLIFLYTQKVKVGASFSVFYQFKSKLNLCLWFYVFNVCQNIFQQKSRWVSN